MNVKSQNMPMYEEIKKEHPLTILPSYQKTRCVEYNTSTRHVPWIIILPHNLGISLIRLRACSTSGYQITGIVI